MVTTVLLFTVPEHFNRRIDTLIRERITRLTSLFSAFLILIGMLPMQALAAYNIDAPETWPAPDSQYTASGKKPVYMLLDYAQNAGIQASHLCTPGAQFLTDIVKATSTTGGHVKYTCDTCGSWAQINVPAVSLSAFTLNPAYQNMMANGVEFSGNPYTVVYDVAPAYQRYIGTELDNHVSVNETGLYSIKIIIESDIYERMELQTEEKLRVYEKAVPWDFTFNNKIYDGTSLLSGNTVSYTDVNGSTISVPLSVYRAKVVNGEYLADESQPVSDPIAAGLYVIRAAITDRNYIWKAGEETANTINVLAWVIPSASNIYVGEPMNIVQLETGNSTYSWSLDNTYTGFDSSSPGLTAVRVNASGIGSVETPVIVAPRPVLSVDPVSAYGSVGDSFSSLNLPDTVTVTAKGTNENITVSGVPVTWDSSVYNSSLLSQSIPGRLNLTGFSQLSTENIPAFSARITLTHGSADTPVIQPFSKTYDGNADALPLPELSAGIASVNVRYKGASYAGNAYESTTPPVNAGSYNATAYFTMQMGYTQLPSVTVPYIISKAPQTCPAPMLAGKTANSLTLNALENAEYSRDGNVWQPGPAFLNLDAGTTYTLYQRLKATNDGIYDVSPAASTQFSTEFTSVNPGDLNLLPQSYPYTGNPISYQVLPISHVARSTVTYTVDGQTTTASPTNAGTYPVIVSFTMQAGTAQLEPVNSTLTITKIEQNAPAAPRAYSTGTNSITVAAIPGAVFSMDGETWQNSTIFEGLTPDTDYTIRAKYPEDRNHYESPISSSVIRTTRQNASAATVQSAVYTYDGTPKKLVAEAPIGCTDVVQSFTGTSSTNYGPTTEPPVNPGVYNVKVSYTMQAGYAELQPQYATLTINKATPSTPPAPVVIDVTDSSITIKVEPGMAYSIDGGSTWQTTETFTGLNRDTVYEIKVKAVKTSCYKELEGPSIMQATEKTLVTFEQFADQTVEYTGHAQTCTLPRHNVGISSMSITGYDGILTPPSNVGSYTVILTLWQRMASSFLKRFPRPGCTLSARPARAGQSVPCWLMKP